MTCVLKQCLALRFGFALGTKGTDGTCICLGENCFSAYGARRQFLRSLRAEASKLLFSKGPDSKYSVWAALFLLQSFDFMLQRESSHRQYVKKVSDCALSFI